MKMNIDLEDSLYAELRELSNKVGVSPEELVEVFVKTEMMRRHIYFSELTKLKMENKAGRSDTGKRS